MCQGIYTQCMHEILWYIKDPVPREDVPDIGFGAGLLQMREDMNCECDKVPDNEL